MWLSVIACCIAAASTFCKSSSDIVIDIVVIRIYLLTPNFLLLIYCLCTSVTTLRTLTLWIDVGHLQFYYWLSISKWSDGQRHFTIRILCYESNPTCVASTNNIDLRERSVETAHCGILVEYAKQIVFFIGKSWVRAQIGNQCHKVVPRTRINVCLYFGQIF